GATPDQVGVLRRRLVELARRYRQELGVDVEHIPGAGAAGGLAGGLAALGARLEPGFDLIARMVDLPRRLDRADAVVTGEGHLDLPSLAGKVVGSIAAAAGRIPLLCVVGAAEVEATARLTGGHPGVEVVDLSRRFGEERARADTVGLVAEVVGGWLARHRAGG
ncbi:MAG: glycerate kinase, partial [Acidimicrobiales bacterium]